MVKPVADATLGGRLRDEIVRGVGILHRLAPLEARDPLRAFREAFVTRYEEREVPLLEALDEEIGIGVGSPDAAGSEAAPLLDGLDLPSPSDDLPFHRTRDAPLLRKLAEATALGATEIALTPADLTAMAAEDPAPLPDAFAVVAVVAAASEEALDRGELRVHI